MKPAILIGAVAVAIGATAWHNNNISISDIIGSKSVGLQCQYADVTEYYTKDALPTSPTTKQHVMVIELSGGTWRIVTIDGQSWKEMVKQGEKEGWAKSGALNMLNMPLRVTDETYVLREPGEDHAGVYDTKNSGWDIDRISGAMTGETWMSEKKGDSHTHLTTTGKCSPIDIKANL